MPSRKWMEIELTPVKEGIRATVRSSEGKQPKAHLLGPAFTREALSRFSQDVERAALRGESLKDGVIEEMWTRAQTFYTAFFQGALGQMFYGLRGASDDEPVLLRLLLQDGALQAFPWEALSEPDANVSTLGSSTDVLLARGVYSEDKWEPREVTGAVRLLAISPLGSSALTDLRASLDESIESGAVEWLEPIVGVRAQVPYLFQFLRRRPTPHIIHFVGHGSVDEKGVPCLLFEDAEGREHWVSVETLTEHLRMDFHKDLRLLVLDACEGARPGALASAAEQLASKGAEAVVAHLWPVKADVARLCSKVFYQALTGTEDSRGDVARSLHHARLMLLSPPHGSAEAFSPVLYLRGNNSRLFDFKHRVVTPPVSDSARTPVHERLPSALFQLREKSFSLLLGDRLPQHSHVLKGFRALLHRNLQEEGLVVPPEISMSALAQRYALRFGEGNLFNEFQTLFGKSDPLPLVRAIAPWVSPGVHITLLRLPFLEAALADSQPHCRIHVIRPPDPGDSRPTVMRYVPPKEGSEQESTQHWEQITKVPDSFDPKQEFIVLRLYGGYLPADILNRPMLTEDDYLQRIGELKAILSSSSALADQLLSVLKVRPAFLLGWSMLTWHHRMLLHRLFDPRPLPDSSLVVVEPPDKAEREMWRSGSSLPGKLGIEVLELSTAELMDFFQGGFPHAEAPP